MTKKKQEFLKKSVGFSMDDLSLTRQIELKAHAKNHPWEWVMLALSKDSLEGWEKWGFKLFNNANFISEVNDLLDAFNSITDEDIKKDEARAKRVKAKSQLHYTNSHLESNWRALKGFDNCDWEYVVGYSSCKPSEISKLKVVPEGIQMLELIRSGNRELSDLTEDEKWLVVLGIRRVRYVYAAKAASN